MSLVSGFVPPRRGNLGLLAIVAFAAGVIASAWLLPALRSHPPVMPSPVVPTAVSSAAHPARVLHVVDGDTFEAQVDIWPGMTVTTKVRLRGIDAPEMHARCAGEYRQAVAARDALVRLLAEGGVGIANVGQDKYGGRVDADVSTSRTRDVSAALRERGLVRSYSGGRRRGWCNG
jgi:endonuclease YncB( thermonuclease family)